MISNSVGSYCFHRHYCPWKAGQILLCPLKKVINSSIFSFERFIEKKLFYNISYEFFSSAATPTTSVIFGWIVIWYFANSDSATAICFRVAGRDDGVGWITSGEGERIKTFFIAAMTGDYKWFKIRFF